MKWLIIFIFMVSLMSCSSVTTSASDMNGISKTGKISYILSLIKEEAIKGFTFIDRPLLEESEVKTFEKLGYSITIGEPGLYVYRGEFNYRFEPFHRISW